MENHLEKLGEFIDGMDSWGVGEEHLAKISLEVVRLSHSLFNGWTNVKGEHVHPAVIANNAESHIDNIRVLIGQMDADNRSTHRAVMDVLQKHAHAARNELASVNAVMEDLKSRVPFSSIKCSEIEQVRGHNQHSLSDPKVRREVWNMTGGKCAYCDKPVTVDGTDTSAETMCVEHVVPRTAGGPDNIANFVPACMGCNSAKSDRHVLHFVRNTLPRRQEKMALRVVPIASTDPEPSVDVSALSRRIQGDRE